MLFRTLGILCLATSAAAGADRIQVRQTADAVEIETDALKAQIRKKGYVSGVAAGSLVDKKTGAKDIGFGLHIMDFLLAPGWRERVSTKRTSSGSPPRL